MSDFNDLIDEVGELTKATTDLIDTTNVSKQSLDEAVDSAEGSAGSAKTDAGTATTKAGESVTARNEAVKAKDEAEAIVYEGEATTEPKPGSIPVAYADAKIDNNWLPFGAVNNPYSGVIGSINKGDWFDFYREGLNDTWSNLIRLKANTTFNINGRFVSNSEIKHIKLQEAEDTADRSIAFDDVFLDWSGNINSFRSITPHRTSTGYDSDAIAVEHGYSKETTGLYKKGDSYSLLLCRVARRNKGAYHPLWNPEGTSKIYTKDHSGYVYGYWYSNTVRDILSGIDCFKNGVPSDPENRIHPDHAGGKLGITSALGRPDDKYYDAIYSDDVTPLYYSAERVTDRQALLFDSFNRAVAGETFMGAEGTNLGVQIRCDNLDGIQIRFPENTVNQASSGTYYPVSMIVYNHSQNKQVPLENPLRYFANGLGEVLIYIENEGDIVVGDLCTLVVYGDQSRPFTKTQLASLRSKFLAVDIIGSLDAMPQEWKDKGIPGNWLAVGEEGEDLIPDGTQKNYKASRKVLEGYLFLESTDRGASWKSNDALLRHFESSDNTLRHNPSAETCYMVFYRTAANPFELANNTVIKSIGDVYYSSDSRYTFGSLLISNMVNKIPTDYKYYRLPLTDYGYTASGGLAVTRNPIHNEIKDKSPTNPSAKILPLLRLVAPNIQLQIVYKELKHNGTQWGDDNKFNIVDNQSTVTDLNGETVIVGQKRVALPYHFDGETY